MTIPPLAQNALGPEREADQRKRTIGLPVAYPRKGLAGWQAVGGHGSVEPPVWLFGDQRVYRLGGTPLRGKVSQARRRSKIGEDEMQRAREKACRIRSKCKSTADPSYSFAAAYDRMAGAINLPLRK